jgi:hypothetical protein
MKEFRAFHNAGSPAPTNLRTGELVAAKFSADNEFYRAKVRRIDRATQKAEIVIPSFSLDLLNPRRLSSTMATKNL